MNERFTSLMLLWQSFFLFGGFSIERGAAAVTPVSADPLSALLRLHQHHETERLLQANSTNSSDFDQINEVLSRATLRLNETTVNVGDGNGTILQFIDLNIQLDVTEQVKGLLEGVVIEIPSDLVSLGRRRHLREERELQNSCPANGGTTGAATFGGTTEILNLVAANLELNFGKEINDIFSLFDVSLPETCISLSNVLSTSGSTANVDSTTFSSLMSETSMSSYLQDGFGLTFGKELDNFLSTFDIALPDLTNRFPTTVLGVTFNLDLNVTGIRCNNFGVKQLNVTIVNNGGDLTDFTNLDLGIKTSATALTATCEGTVSFGVGQLTAQGGFKAQGIGNQFDLDLRFAGGSLSVNSCGAAIAIQNVDLSKVKILFVNLADGFVNGLFNLVDNLIFGFVQDQANACTSLF
jgi:hypothetical protein